MKKSKLVWIYLTGHTRRIRDGERLCRYCRGYRWTTLTEVHTGYTDRIRTDIFDGIRKKEVQND